MPPDKIPYVFLPDRVRIKGVIKVEIQVFNEVGVQFVRIVVFHPKEKVLVPVQAEEVFHKMVIHFFRVQSSGLKTGQEGPKVGF